MTRQLARGACVDGYVCGWLASLGSRDPVGETSHRRWGRGEVAAGGTACGREFTVLILLAARTSIGFIATRIVVDGAIALRGGYRPGTDGAITCFLVVPGYRRRGLDSFLLREVMGDLRRRGVCRVEAFLTRGKPRSAEDLWHGPVSMFRAVGLSVIRDEPTRPVLALNL